MHLFEIFGVLKIVRYVHVKVVTNKNLLYSVKELYSILCNGLYGKRFLKGIDICVCKTDSLCYTSKTNTTL